ncbi:hypothetical protein FFF34_010705 [Inquilinus sp. KBS0705]|nr:hypothetical protein FFF34_010705 [Inquilinus sp. KBS0705]
MKVLFRYLFLILVALFTLDVSAQVTDVRSLRPSNTPANKFNSVRTNQGTGKKLVAARNRFITQQLSLTDDEARKFWPLYNKYQQELTAVRILKRLNNSNAQANGADQVNKDLEYDSQTLAIKKRYRDEFYKILPPEKVSELYKSESEFKDELIKQLSERSVRAGN